MSGKRDIITETVPGLSREAVFTLNQAVVQDYLRRESEGRERVQVDPERLPKKSPPGREER